MIRNIVLDLTLMMSDPIHSSNDGLVQEPSLELPDDGKPMEEIAVENTDNVSRSKLQIAAILVALNVGLSVLPLFPFFFSLTDTL